MIPNAIPTPLPRPDDNAPHAVWRAYYRRAQEVYRADRQAKHQAELAVSAARWKAFFAPTPMAPIPFFADLRQAVISGPIPPKRMPKWYWSLSPESALLLQPSDRRGCLFSGLVLDGPNITRETFRRPQGQRPRAIRALDFWIFDGDPDGSVWQFRPRSGFSPPEAAGAFRDVVLARLTPAVCANVDAVALLVPQCLVCGKVLTDPVSQARWIGPECAGRSRSLPPSLRLRVQLLPDLAGGHLAHPLDVEPEA